jgi:class 3 adenylate cyclase
MVNEIQDFVQGTVPSDETARVLSTVLCVDTVSGAGEDEAVRQIRRHRGKLVNNDEAGVLATFDGPARAIRAATEIAGAATTGDALRAGLHCGECEVIGDEVRGIAVSIAAQLAGRAPAGRVLVSQTVRDLIVGSEIALDPHGPLDGVPGDWSTFLVVGV